MLLDWLVIAAYLIVITVLGASAAKKVKTASDFFISDRKFGKLMMTLFTFGTGTNTDQAVSVASKTYTSGASGIWYQWLWLFSTPFYWLLAPLFRRMRAVTIADYLQARYDQSVAILFAVLGIAQLSVNIGVTLKAAGAMVTAVSGGAISAEVAIVSMTALFMVYGIVGGLSAAIMTDALQGILTVVLSFLLLPFALQAVGGLDGLRASVADPTVFQVVAPGEITTFYVVVISLNALIGWVATPYSMALCGAGTTDQEARVGLISGMFLKRICTIAWVLTAMCGIGIYAGSTVDPDQLYGLLARDLLPTIAPGLVGLFIASMLAAVMSSCDALMVSAAALFTENVYRPLIRPGRDQAHYILVGRVSSGVVVLAGITVAFGLESVVEGLEMFWKVAAMMGLSIWVSFVWRRATVAAVWASTLGGFLAWAATARIDWIGWDFSARYAASLPDFMVWQGELSLPWQMTIYLSVSFLLMVMVSLTTRAPDDKTLDRVYTALRTPVLPGEPEVEPLCLPSSTEPAPRQVLIDHPDFEIPIPDRSTVIGFVVSWAAVAALIAMFFWILS